MSVVISIENLWKEYRLGVIGHGTLTHDLQSWFARVRQKEDPNAKISALMKEKDKQVVGNKFWALRDVNLKIMSGEIVGIIGKNGAGKSTLLKILSRVTAPTSGHIRVKGRIASLLEVGTGFHPELTGRENIFLNGAILGMSKREVKGKLDEIIDFSGVEQHIDTPVKRYSSGMHVRLAFAVAAHLEPEILVVDEVLAVGDAEFQKRCLGKMGEVASEGRTVLLVSHNMNSIEMLCGRACLLDRGKIIQESQDVRAVVNGYLFKQGSGCSTSWVNVDCEYQHENFQPQRVYLSDDTGQPINGPIHNDAEISIHIEAVIGNEHPALQVGYALYNENGVLLYWTFFTDVEQEKWPKVRSGGCRFSSYLPKRLLNEGKYKLELLSAIYHREWINKPGKGNPFVDFEIKGGLSDSVYWLERRPGAFAPVFQWNFKNFEQEIGYSTIS
jgi:lipopolysaccharide transport system ATP-binding protein